MNEKQRTKREEKCLDDACTLLGNIEFKKAAHEIECIEIVSGLLYDIESYRESIKNLKKKLKTPIRKWKRR